MQGCRVCNFDLCGACAGEVISFRGDNNDQKCSPSMETVKQQLERNAAHQELVKSAHDQETRDFGQYLRRINAQRAALAMAEEQAHSVHEKHVANLTKNVELLRNKHATLLLDLEQACERENTQAQMETGPAVTEDTAEHANDDANDADADQTNTHSEATDNPSSYTNPGIWTTQLAVLADMGFLDHEKLTWLLDETRGDVQRVVSCIVSA